MGQLFQCSPSVTRNRDYSNWCLQYLFISSNRVRYARCMAEVFRTWLYLNHRQMRASKS